VKIGIVVRADDTGLGNQTRELVKMLNPERVLLIDSSRFHNRNPQNYEWYKEQNVIKSYGMPDNRTLMRFLPGLDVAISCETFYSKHFVTFARKKKVKTILQYNFEFLENLSNDQIGLPDVFLAPSLWRFEEIQEKFGDRALVTYLPPPTDEKLFEKGREKNKQKSGRLLHIGGKAAIYDRNGTNSVIEMLKYSKKDYELVIKSQTKLDLECKDERLNFIVGNEKNREDLYFGHDAMILPRRYAGLCLPMNEALMSGLPVFMTNISPNNKVLPGGWLADSSFVKTFMARIGIDLYEANPEHLAEIVDKYFSQKNLSKDKEMAFSLGYDNFSASELKQKYIDLIQSLL
jgi:hypothetical protein